ncbi:MAG: D-aminoacyl-tRNA deacylase [Desulfobulbaceae bacterium]|nr:D-aminoacyl-tRNA deacylase [Desulfobulbaceae bacterium]
MRAVLQVVSQASVRVDHQTIGAIKHGLLVLLGVGETDSEKEADSLAAKISTLRIFPDHNGQMNKSLQDVGGEVLVVSQFTLYADCRKGRRPSYNQAAPPDLAKRLYLYFIEQVKALGITVSCGQFQAMMNVSLINQGPITIILDTNRG